jgi:hypothetical protein
MSVRPRLRKQRKRNLKTVIELMNFPWYYLSGLLSVTTDIIAIQPQDKTESTEETSSELPKNDIEAPEVEDAVRSASRYAPPSTHSLHSFVTTNTVAHGNSGKSVDDLFAYNPPSLSNPFASLITRPSHIRPPAVEVEAKPGDIAADRYWCHDQVQDELRFDFRTRNDGKSATEVCRDYLSELPEDVTVDVDVENIVGGKNLRAIPELLPDQWRAIYATMFLERCEMNGW